MKVRIQDKLFMKKRFLFYITKQYSIPIIEPIVKYLHVKEEDLSESEEALLYGDLLHRWLNSPESVKVNSHD